MVALIVFRTTLQRDCVIELHFAGYVDFEYFLRRNVAVISGFVLVF